MRIGDWERPWNAKVPTGRAAPNPQKHPYTLWANTEIGEGQVGCIYSAQGFEFDSVGVSGGLEPVWRTDRWVAQPKESRDSPVRNSGDEMVNLVRNAYRVRPARGIRETRVLCLDPETRAHLTELAGRSNNFASCCWFASRIFQSA